MDVCYLLVNVQEIRIQPYFCVKQDDYFFWNTLYHKDYYFYCVWDADSVGAEHQKQIMSFGKIGMLMLLPKSLRYKKDSNRFNIERYLNLRVESVKQSKI